VTPSRLILACSAFAASCIGPLAAEPADSAPAPAAVPRLCPPPPPDLLPPPAGSADERIHLDAAQSEIDRDGTTRMSGGVTARQGERTMRTERLEYSRERGALKADGGIVFRDPRVTIEAPRAEVDLDADTGVFPDASFRLHERYARGTAAEARRLDANRSRLTDVFITTCPEGDDDWKLSAERIDFDHANGIGAGRDVWLRFMGVPLFYTPYISFPIDDRRMSGFLPPEIGTTDRSGAEFVQPYYWNIAPNYDATLTLHPTSKRGLILENEFRYLWGRGTGHVELDALPDDRLREETRGRLRLKDDTRLGGGWRTELEANAVSDPSWFEDLGSSLTATTQTHLEQRFDLVHSGIDHAFRAGLLGYQITDPTVASIDHPYDKLPALSLSALDAGGPLGLHYELSAELVNFHHDERVRGIRTDVKPRAWLPLRGAGWYVTPSAALRYTHYSLSNDPAFDEAIARSLPVYSVDAGLVFERDVDWGGDYRQTLEPRVYYLYVPYRDQSGIPLFDTTIPDVSLYQLFRDNRFIGADRVGDAHQLSAALSSRLIDPRNGRVLLTGSIGQITYFNDRRVTLAGPADTTGRSELIAELGTDPTRALSLTTALVYDPLNKETDRSAVQLRWQPEPRQALNLSYRFRRDAIEQTDLAFAWPVAPRWRVVGRWNYSLQDRQSLESFGGIEYETCCWTVRLVSRRYIFNRAGEFDRTLFLQLELKGLASIGKSTDALLQRGIPGYGTRLEN
jgi:LPS-assembly protein